MRCHKFGGNWQSRSGEEDLVKIVNIYTGSNTVEHFLGGVSKHRINTMFWTNSKHGYWSNGSGEEDEIVKSLQTNRQKDGQSTDNSNLYKTPLKFLAQVSS